LTSYTQTYIIPGTDEQPAWVFPLWFEDGLGNKDTLYFGYDPSGQDFGWPQSDSIFGEKLITVDTSKFNVYWESGFLLPSALKVLIWQNLEFGSNISFVHTFYPPLILRWDSNLFYNSIIPYPDLEPLPDACGEITSSGDMSTDGCSFMYPIIITDTTQGGGLVCYFSDSIIYNTGSLSGLGFKVIPWKPNFLFNEENKNDLNPFEIYPNPVNSILYLDKKINGEYMYQIFDGTGMLLQKGNTSSSTTISFKDYSAGIYILNLISNNLLITYKIIKL